MGQAANQIYATIWLGSAVPKAGIRGH